MKDLLNSFSYNSIVILSYFFLSLIILGINYLTHDKLNKYLFSNYVSAPWNPLTYFRLFSHSLGHENFEHLMNNFVYILLVGPMIEEKYGSINLLIMILITSLVCSLINIIFVRNRILGSSGITFMLIVLSSAVNLVNGKIPISLILILLFHVIEEVIKAFRKNDHISHISHIVGACCGIIFSFYFK